MKINQLSLFVENRPGQLRMVTRILAENNVDIRSLSLADTQQFGILRLIVDDHDKARSVLEAAGCVVNVTQVLAVEVPDRPGGLDALLAVLEDAGITVEYMYAFTNCRGDSAVLFFRFEDIDTALAVLEKGGIQVVKSVDLFS